MSEQKSSSDASSDRLICFCHTVSHAALVKAIREGHDTLEKIQAETCASTGCGGCELYVREILEAELSQKKPGT